MAVGIVAGLVAEQSFATGIIITVVLAVYHIMLMTEHTITAEWPLKPCPLLKKDTPSHAASPTVEVASLLGRFVKRAASKSLGDELRMEWRDMVFTRV